MANATTTAITLTNSPTDVSATDVSPHRGSARVVLSSNGPDERNASGDIAKYSPGMADRNQDWNNALKALAGGGKLVWSYHQIILFARPSQAAKAESAIRDLWRARGFELVIDGYIHRAALMQSLPMGLSKPFAADLQRLKRLELRTSGNTIHLAPMVAEGKGTGTPTMVFVGRRGQLTRSDGSRHPRCQTPRAP